MRYVVLFALFFGGFSCQPSSENTTVSANWSAGFLVLKGTDSSRTYRPESALTDPLHFRPLDIDVFYPTGPRSATDTLLTLGHYLRLFEQRASYYTASDAGNGLAGQLAKYLTDSLRCATPTQLLQAPTATYRNARPVEGRFPLVLYMASFNGMAHENTTLLGQLAKRGYVVASVSSIGSWPGDMTMRQKDLGEQVADARYVLQRLKRQPNVDSSRVAVLGYSWGGLAGAVLASERSDIKALISLDGSEFHHYGDSAEEDSLFNALRPLLPARAIRAPYLRLESTLPAPKGKAKPVFDFAKTLAQPGQTYRITGAGHEDFSHFPLLTKRAGNCPYGRQYDVVTKLTLAFLDSQLRGQTATFADSLRSEQGKTLR